MLPVYILKLTKRSLPRVLCYSFIQRRSLTVLDSEMYMCTAAFCLPFHKHK